MVVRSWLTRVLMAEAEGGDEGGSAGLAGAIESEVMTGGDDAAGDSDAPAAADEGGESETAGDDEGAAEEDPGDPSEDLAALLMSDDGDSVSDDEGDDEPADPDGDPESAGSKDAEGTGQDPPPEPVADPWLRDLLPDFQGTPQQAIQALLQEQNQLQPLARIGQQLVQQRQPPQQDQPLVPLPPHRGDKQVDAATKLFHSGDERFDKLPQTLQAKAQERAGYEERVAALLMGDPEGYFGEFMLPQFERLLAPIREGFHDLTNAEFLRRNSELLKTKEDRLKLAGFIRQNPNAGPDAALRELQRDKREAGLEAELKTLRAERGAVKSQKKTQDAIDNDRRSRSGKGKRRRGRTFQPMSAPTNASAAFAQALCSTDADDDE